MNRFAVYDSMGCERARVFNVFHTHSCIATRPGEKLRKTVERGEAQKGLTDEERNASYDFVVA